jgi:hypothetical protein
MFDGNLTSVYTNYENCNTGSSTISITCGKNTGLYLTLNSEPFILVAFSIGTVPTYSTRDPLTITIESSNLTGSALTLGSSWTLIYNGSSGLTLDPGRATMGPLQILPKFSIQFTSYRLLVTSKKDNDTCTSYSEAALFGQ